MQGGAYEVQNSPEVGVGTLPRLLCPHTHDAAALHRCGSARCTHQSPVLPFTSGMLA